MRVEDLLLMAREIGSGMGRAAREKLAIDVSRAVLGEPVQLLRSPGGVPTLSVALRAEDRAELEARGQLDYFRRKGIPERLSHEGQGKALDLNDAWTRRQVERLGGVERVRRLAAVRSREEWATATGNGPEAA
jgi:hypothetical protein